MHCNSCQTDTVDTQTRNETTAHRENNVTKMEKKKSFMVVMGLTLTYK